MPGCFLNDCGHGFSWPIKNPTDRREKQDDAENVPGKTRPHPHRPASYSPALLHQQRLARAFDREGQAPLVMRRKARVFARQQPALIGDKLAEQIGVFKIKRFGGKVNLRLRPGRAAFHRAMGTLAIGSFFVGFAGHGYLISR